MVKERLKFELWIGVGKKLITVKEKSCDIKKALPNAIYLSKL